MFFHNEGNLPDLSQCVQAGCAAYSLTCSEETVCHRAGRQRFPPHSSCITQPAPDLWHAVLKQAQRIGSTSIKEIYFTNSEKCSNHLTPWHSLICSLREGSFLRSRRQIQHWDRISTTEPTFPINNLLKTCTHTGKGGGIDCNNFKWQLKSYHNRTSNAICRSSHSWTIFHNFHRTEGCPYAQCGHASWHWWSGWSWSRTLGNSLHRLGGDAGSGNSQAHLHTFIHEKFKHHKKSRRFDVI